MDVSVVIPAYNEEKWIEATLEALGEQDPGEIIVVDNNSTDKTARIAQKYADLVLRQKQQGVAHARNLGAAGASNSIIAFLDADCIPEPGWLGSIEKKFSSTAIGMTGPIMPQEKNLIHSFNYYLCWTLISRILVGIGRPLIPGGNFACRQSTFLGINGFRTDIFPGEDIELSKRLWGKGKFKFNPKMQVRTRTKRFDQFGYTSEIKKWITVFSKMRKGETWSYPYPPVR